ncbi:unnamed protein product [Blumeria hordei]|uniref:Uncharacterized protein n=1 Tax=Blumeria hordei TaxID=2867405 RepID=A0A383UIK7_BLUHO|nr:unnamed protein product [Blumeria hordei]
MRSLVYVAAYLLVKATHVKCNEKISDLLKTFVCETNHHRKIFHAADLTNKRATACTNVYGTEDFDPLDPLKPLHPIGGNTWELDPNYFVRPKRQKVEMDLNTKEFHVFSDNEPKTLMESHEKPPNIKYYYHIFEEEKISLDVQHNSRHRRVDFQDFRLIHQKDKITVKYALIIDQSCQIAAIMMVPDSSPAIRGIKNVSTSILNLQDRVFCRIKMPPHFAIRKHRQNQVGSRQRAAMRKQRHPVAIDYCTPSLWFTPGSKEKTPLLERLGSFGSTRITAGVKEKTPLFERLGSFGSTRITAGSKEKKPILEHSDSIGSSRYLDEPWLEILSKN